MENQPKNNFTSNLLHWNKFSNNRVMPWKGEKDPYKIWISEIMLQQTRVEQGIGYFNRFMEAFPSIQDLAAADDDKVFKLWEGLGYYARCRNMLETARIVVSNYKSFFPNTYEQIANLKGIGPYTASAIASFAFNLPHAVVDGNVLRVLSRYFGISDPIDTTASRKKFNELANGLLNQENPAQYNQAIMDFGATICKPKAPLCNNCPLQTDCRALQSNLVDKLPIKSKRLIKKDRFFHYILFKYENTIFCRKRIEKDIWQNLFEFYLVEADKMFTTKELFESDGMVNILKDIHYEVKTISTMYKQQLTHQVITGVFYTVEVESFLELGAGFLAVDETQIRSLPLPKFIFSYLDQNQ
jgi:A/G-specific adenine glycosylase